MSTYLSIALGGAAGSVLRFLAQAMIQRSAGVAFPFGTLLVNVSGSFVLGLLAGAFGEEAVIAEEYRHGLTVGLLGGYTTFSAFGMEAFKLLDDGKTRLACLYVLASSLAGIAAAGAGYFIAK